jgi:hypothetical protein
MEHRSLGSCTFAPSPPRRPATCTYARLSSARVAGSHPRGFVPFPMTGARLLTRGWPPAAAGGFVAGRSCAPTSRAPVGWGRVRRWPRRPGVGSCALRDPVGRVLSVQEGAPSLLCLRWRDRTRRAVARRVDSASSCEGSILREPSQETAYAPPVRNIVRPCRTERRIAPGNRKAASHKHAPVTRRDVRDSRASPTDSNRSTPFRASPCLPSGVSQQSMLPLTSKPRTAGTIDANCVETALAVGRRGGVSL